MFKYRIISFPLLLALVGAMIFWKEGGIWIFSVIAPILMGLVTYEVCTMLKRIEIKTFAKTFSIVMVISSIILLLLIKGSISYEIIRYVFCSFVLCPLACIVPLLWVKDRKNYLQCIFNSVGITTLLAMLFFPLIIIFNSNSYSFLYLVIVTKMMDTGGYIAGVLSNKFMKNGNHKIYPSLSPKKSYEGTIGGIILSMLLAYIFYIVEISPFNLQMTLISGFILAIGSLAGDLTESAIKRSCDIKDSGSIIPGMGGIFDVLDSFIYNGVIFFVLIFR